MEVKESITRCKRHIQNHDKELLPTKKTDNRTKILEEQYKTFFR